MNRVLSLLLIVLSVSTFVHAQTNQLTFGLDGGLPSNFKEVATFTGGVSAGFEIPVGQTAITAHAAYHFVFLTSDAQNIQKNMTLIPLQAGVKYFIQDQQRGLYVHAQGGVHIVGRTYQDDFPQEFRLSTSESKFSWAGGVGYQFEKIDIGGRFNSIPGDIPYDYWGLRVAYIINL